MIKFNLIKITSFRSEQPISFESNLSHNYSSETLSGISQPSVILRDTSIREHSSSPPIKDSQTFYRGSLFGAHTDHNSSRYQLRERECKLSSNKLNIISPMVIQTSCSGSKENNTNVLREGMAYSMSRVASNRFLSSALDQRIIKQSTEDCRRLLQQVRNVHKSCRV